MHTPTLFLGPAMVVMSLLSLPAGAAIPGGVGGVVEALFASGAGRQDMTRGDKAAPAPQVWRLDDAVRDAVLADARQRASSADARVASAERVTWRDGSIGCPEPGMVYTQALVNGWRAVVEAGGQTLIYHGTQRGNWVHCPRHRAAEPIRSLPTI